MAHPIQTACEPCILDKVYMIRVYGHRIIDGVRENCLVAPAYKSREAAEASIAWREERYPALFFREEVEEVYLI